jgi:hypothetical protein
MTLKLRNNFFILGLSFSGVLTLTFLTGTATLLIRFPREIPLAALFSPRAVPYLQGILPLVLLNFFILAAGILILLSFRKTSSPEIFFLFLFLMSLGTESFRLGLLYLNIMNIPFEFGLLLSRFVYFGRLMGTLALFSAGLFSCGIPYQRLEITLGSCFLVALALASNLPLESGVQGWDLLYRNSLTTEFALGLLTVELLGMGNLLYAVKVHNDRNYYALALGTGALILGKFLIFSGEGLIPGIAGIAALAGGTLLFGKKTHQIYLWF